MARFHLLTGIGLATLFSQGCATCFHQAIVTSQKADCGQRVIDSCQRNHVHVFLINGSDPLHHLTLLRDRLNEAGYTKIYYGQIYHTADFERQIRQIHAIDPTDRFLLVSYGVGASATDAMATRITGDGIGIDTIFDLSPNYLGTPMAGSPRQVILPHGSQPNASNPNSEVVVLPGVCSMSLANHPEVISRVLSAVNTSAMQLPPPAELSPRLPMIDDPAPLPFLDENPTARREPGPLPAPGTPSPPSKPIPTVPRQVQPGTPGTLTNRESSTPQSE